MDELARWLGQQLDEDKRAAEGAAEELGADWYYDDGFVLARREDDMVATGSQDFLELKYGAHIVRHDPARVLREIDAKRRILYLAVQLPKVTASTDLFDNNRDAWAEVLKQLALPYSNRSGYREEWRP